MTNKIKEAYDVVQIINQIAADFYTNPEIISFDNFCLYQKQLETCLLFLDDQDIAESYAYAVAVRRMLSEINEHIDSYN